MKPRKEGETDAAYIKRLESRNDSLKRENDSLAKWAKSITRSVTSLSVEASTAFQAMAELAGVRSHPSVNKAVELFDFIAHPQWTGADKMPPSVEFPTDWDFDEPTAWSGDADMVLNSPVADAVEYLRSRLLKGCSEQERKWVGDLITRLDGAALSVTDGVKEQCGFRPLTASIPPGEHYKVMTKEQLEELVSAMGWMALDLAQDMAFANEMLRRDLRAATYRRICSDLYRLAWLDTNNKPGAIDLKIFSSEEVPF